MASGTTDRQSQSSGYQPRTSIARSHSCPMERGCRSSRHPQHAVLWPSPSASMLCPKCRSPNMLPRVALPELFSVRVLPNTALLNCQLAKRPRNLPAYLSEMVRKRRNILISGGTSTGKTTLLSALMKEMAGRKRLVLIEDTAELHVTHPNRLDCLQFAASSAKHGSRPTTCFRLRCGCVLTGSFWVNCVARKLTPSCARSTAAIPGSLTTIHADSPERAIEQLALIVLQTGTQLTREDIVHYVRTVVDVVIQLDRRDGRRIDFARSWRIAAK